MPHCRAALISVRKSLGRHAIAIVHLTYARRYALFTLVGIAGEDDLDAPDLGADPESEIPIEPNGRRATKEDVATDRVNGSRGRKRPRTFIANRIGCVCVQSLRVSTLVPFTASSELVHFETTLGVTKRAKIAKRSQFRDPVPMTSPKQIEANRRNATDGGARFSANAQYLKR